MRAGGRASATRWADRDPSTSHAMLPVMSQRREHLLDQLRSHYARHGWSVKQDDEGTLLASEPGGVTWLGTALVSSDLASETVEERLVELSERRMPGGAELCPLDLVADDACEADVRALLNRLGLAGRPHVSLYSLAAA